MFDARKSMLVVEDDDALRARLARSLERRGYRVVTAAGVAEAAERLSAGAPDYAIVDLRLRDGSGLDVIEALETRAPAARAVILTGYGDIPTAVAAAKLGAADYLAKPASAEEILDTLLAPADERPPAPADPIPPDAARWEHIEQVFEEAGRNVSHAARLLNMHRRTLQRILKRHGEGADA